MIFGGINLGIENPQLGSAGKNTKENIDTFIKHIKELGYSIIGVI